MKCLPLILAACTALLVVSCSPSYWMQWNLGECIRHTETVHKGVDVRRPVDGKLYLFPEEAETWVVRAEEVTYVTDSPSLISRRRNWSELSLFTDAGQGRARVLEPTGRVVVAEVQGTAESNDVYFVRELPAMPQGCTTCPPHRRKKPQPPTARAFGKLDGHTLPEWGLTLLAAPFDYVLDPALSLLSTGLTYTLEHGIAPVVEAVIAQQQAP